jgi:hypothetical protein
LLGIANHDFVLQVDRLEGLGCHHNFILFQIHFDLDQHQAFTPLWISSLALMALSNRIRFIPKPTGDTPDKCTARLPEALKSCITARHYNPSTVVWLKTPLAEFRWIAA